MTEVTRLIPTPPKTMCDLIFKLPSGFPRTPLIEIELAMCEAYFEIFNILIEDILPVVLIKNFKDIITNAVDKLLADIAWDTLEGLIKDLNEIVTKASNELLLWENQQMSNPMKTWYSISFSSSDVVTIKWNLRKCCLVTPGGKTALHKVEWYRLFQHYQR